MFWNDIVTAVKWICLVTSWMALACAIFYGVVFGFHWERVIMDVNGKTFIAVYVKGISGLIFYAAVTTMLYLWLKDRVHPSRRKYEN